MGTAMMALTMGQVLVMLLRVFLMWAWVGWASWCRLRGRKGCTEGSWTEVVASREAKVATSIVESRRGSLPSSPRTWLPPSRLPTQ
jgi:hypothetical protein